MSKLNFKAGTAMLDAKINQSPNATKFDFFEFRTNEGEISLKLRNKNELRFTHKYNNILNVITFNFDDYFDKKIQIGVTWDVEAKELNLYIGGELKKTERMN